MIKRIFDFLLALFLLIILIPLFLILAILIKINIDGEIFFIQARPGYMNKLFKLIKFRTMNSKRNQYGELLPDKKRLTKFGSWLRKTSLDELPALINILKGEMSFIGPRPLLPEYMKYYTKEELKRHSVKPGLSGWAQINGRNLISWEKKFELDIWYVNNRNLILDLKIFFITFWKVLKKEGVNSEDQNTMPKFKR